MSDSVRPHRQQPTRLPHPWDSPGKNTRVGCHFLLQCIKVKSESEVAQSCLTRSDPWTAAHQTPPLHVLGKLQSDMSYHAVGSEFKVNESKTYIKSIIT